MAIRKCLPVENGGCGLEKPIEAFELCKVNMNGTPNYRSRCRVCQRVWRKLPLEVRVTMHMIKKAPDPVNSQRRCESPEFGGCGQLKDLSEFTLDKPRADGTRKPKRRCKSCQNKFKRMSQEDRERLAINPGPCKVLPVKTDDFLGSYFFTMAATDCERNYWEVGRACA